MKLFNTLTSIEWQNKPVSHTWKANTKIDSILIVYSKGIMFRTGFLLHDANPLIYTFYIWSYKLSMSNWFGFVLRGCKDAGCRMQSLTQDFSYYFINNIAVWATYNHVVLYDTTWSSVNTYSGGHQLLNLLHVIMTMTHHRNQLRNFF